MMKAPTKLSGLQYDVLALYRSFLRAAVKKSGRSSDLYQFVKTEFREQSAQVGRLDFRMVEHSIRQGKKKLKLMEMPGFKAAHAASSSPGTDKHC